MIMFNSTKNCGAVMRYGRLSKLSFLSFFEFRQILILETMKVDLKIQKKKLVRLYISSLT